MQQCAPPVNTETIKSGCPRPVTSVPLAISGMSFRAGLPQYQRSSGRPLCRDRALWFRSITCRQ